MSPEALAQLMTKQSHKLLTSLGILSEEELHSRYHVRLERYIKDMLIELHTLREIVDTMVLPAAFEYSGRLAEGAARHGVPQMAKPPGQSHSQLVEPGADS